MSLGKHWKDHKANLKRKYYDSKATDEDQYKSCSRDVLSDQWISLIHCWNSDAGKKISEINKRNRSCQKLPHTTGTKNFATIRYEEKCKSSTHQDPTRVDFFIKTHRKNSLPVNDETQHVIKKMQDAVKNWMVCRIRPLRMTCYLRSWGKTNLVESMLWIWHDPH